ncbi:MAG: hypothetical protein DMF85_15160 [Acidobacteria bacterium]|nr:MAG: hypothetical protein DMF85_15160 [Acidobacteriota bacterium]
MPQRCSGAGRAPLECEGLAPPLEPAEDGALDDDEDAVDPAEEPPDGDEEDEPAEEPPPELLPPPRGSALPRGPLSCVGRWASAGVAASARPATNAVTVTLNRVMSAPPRCGEI